MRDTAPVSRAVPTGVTAALGSATIVGIVAHSADPRRARAFLERLGETYPDVVAEMAEEAAEDPGVEDPGATSSAATRKGGASPWGPSLLARGAVALACASRSLSAAVLRDPALLGPLRDAEALAHPWDTSIGPHTSDRSVEMDDPSELRRFKLSVIVRIALRDLLGLSDLPTVGRELAALADACLAGAATLASPTMPVAVIGMGKLGGRELNYASDVDVLFVHDGPASDGEHAARQILAIMAAPSEDGIVFRTDANLRPEGRSGALSRSVDAYDAYYARWAQNWELQALIKARPAAGDVALRARFAAMIEPYVWPPSRPEDAVREVRAMKARSEQETDRRGLGDRELKRGRGGIRDIEFSVQLLQLVHGCQDASVRSANTLDALEQLALAGYVDGTDASRLADLYVFLRTVEHRLQLEDEQQTHTLPADVDARRRLARVLGYRDTGDVSALARFDAEHRHRQAEVRSLHEKLFFAPILDTLAGRDGVLRTGAAEERLRAFGFVDVPATRAALDELTRGLSRTSRVMEQLLPVLLEWCSETPDPDLALLQLRRLAEGPARSASLAVTFRDSPGAAERTCRLLGASRLLGDALRRRPDVVSELADERFLHEEKTRERIIAEALAAVRWRTADVEARRAGLRRFKRRELLRIAARDVLGVADVATTGRALCELGEACVEAALTTLTPTVPFAVLGMGRFGGRELSYASDIDVLFVYRGAGPADFAEGERIAEALMVEIGATTAEGQTFRIDADLRPEGKQGPLARSLEGMRAYYERWALTWERQSLTKARAVAGDRAVADEFLDIVHPLVYRDPFPDDDAREIRRMKARIERERIPPGEDPQFHLKLGRGSLSDVEFTAQLLQMRFGAAHASLRTTETVTALDALMALGLLDSDDGRALLESLEYCLAARNARYLVTGSTRESLPSDPAEAAHMARLLGYVHRPAMAMRDDYRRVTRRARSVVDRVFYGHA